MLVASHLVSNICRNTAFNLFAIYYNYKIYNTYKLFALGLRISHKLKIC